MAVVAAACSGNGDDTDQGAEETTTTSGAEFLEPNGPIIDVCGGAPCQTLR